MSARWISLVALVVAMFVAAPASAARRGYTDMLGDSAAGLVEARSPSKEHRWGTVFVFGRPMFSSDLVAIEWDVFTMRELRRVSLGAVPDHASVTHAVRSGDGRIFVVNGGGGDATPITLFEIGAEDMTVRSREIVGRGMIPSLAVDDGFVVVGSYVEEPDSFGWLRRCAWHASVLERATGRIVGARVFRNGDSLSIPAHASQDAGHAVVLASGHAYISLPGATSTVVVEARLPSLTVEHERQLPLRRSLGGAPAPVYRVGASFVVLADDWYELDATLDLVAQRRARNVSTIASNANGSWVYVDGDSVEPRPGTTFFFKPAPAAHASAIAWGHLVWLRLGDGRWEGDGFVNVR